MRKEIKTTDRGKSDALDVDESVTADDTSQTPAAATPSSLSPRDESNGTTSPGSVSQVNASPRIATLAGPRRIVQAVKLKTDVSHHIVVMKNNMRRGQEEVKKHHATMGTPPPLPPSLRSDADARSPSPETISPRIARLATPRKTATARKPTGNVARHVEEMKRAQIQKISSRTGHALWGPPRIAQTPHSPTREYENDTSPPVFHKLTNPNHFTVAYKAKAGNAQSGKAKQHTEVVVHSLADITRSELGLKGNRKKKTRSHRNAARHDAIFKKLTSPDRYTGASKYRFDEAGRGRGLDGHDEAWKGSGSMSASRHYRGGMVHDLSQITRSTWGSGSILVWFGLVFI